jgi:hypothetical protein
MSSAVRKQFTESSNVDWQTRHEQSDAQRRRRDHANLEAMQNLILDAIVCKRDVELSPKVRAFISAIQSAHGGGETINEPFQRSHESVAAYLQFIGAKEAKAARVRRLINRLEEFQNKTGYKLLHIKRGGAPTGIKNPDGSDVYSSTEYTDHLKPIADVAVMRARDTELWRGNIDKGIRANPGRAMAAQVELAVSQLPSLKSNTEETKKKNSLNLNDYLVQQSDRVQSSFENIFEGVEERQGDADVCMAWLERQYSDARRALESRRKTARARLDFSMLEEEIEPVEAEAEATRMSGLPEKPPANSEENVSNVDAALIYAARGWHVVPCAEHGKKPLIIEWQKRAATNEKTIREWWRKWPDANIGIATGAASGFVVLDIDPRHGGDASLTELVEQHGELPPTMRAATGGGGQHLLFAHPGVAIKNSSSLLGEGLDVRGDGGQIIAPPSLHESGRVYEWLNVTKPAPLPEWLLKRLTQEKPIPLSAAARNLRPQAESGATTKDLIIEGGRNDFLFRRVASWRAGKGESYEEIEAAVLEANERQCSPPLTAIECQQIARSAYTLETRKRAGAGVCADVRV